MIGFTSASRVGDRDLNGCVKGMTGGGGMEVRGDVVVFKEVGMGRGAGVYGDVSVFDLAVLKRYFRLWGHVSGEFYILIQKMKANVHVEDVLNEALMSP